MSENAIDPNTMSIIVTKGSLDWAYPPYILGTTAAATSQCSVGCGIAKVRARSTAKCVSNAASTSSGEIFSPPRLITSSRRPRRRR